MEGPSIRHSDALLIAWRLAELEATNLKQDELEPVHFFLGLLKLAELDVDAILGDHSTLSSERIQQETNRVSRMCKCFRAAGIETTSARRKLRQALPRGDAGLLKGQRVRRSALPLPRVPAPGDHLRIPRDLARRPHRAAGAGAVALFAPFADRRSGAAKRNPEPFVPPTGSCSAEHRCAMLREQRVPAIRCATAGTTDQIDWRKG